MIDTILQTKLTPPVITHASLPRKKLVERLQFGLAKKAKLTLILAPAGYGKTTLGARWFAELNGCGVWLSLSSQENEPNQLLRYLVASLQRLDHTLGETVVQMLTMPQMPPLKNLFTLLINELSTWTQPVRLFLDDYHLIDNRDIDDAFCFFLQNIPDNVHLVLLTRKLPHIGLPQLRAYGHVSELLAQDCRFTKAETHAFFHEMMSLPIDNAVLDILEQKMEGWAAGLNIAALSLRNRLRRGDDAILSFMEEFDSHHQVIHDFLLTEVLSPLPEDIQSFLYKTAVLEQMTPALCQAITGRDDSRHLIRQLEQGNYFLISLDERREWYRYHQLFADFLRQQITASEKQEVHSRAYQWFAQKAEWGEAIEQALLAHNFEAAISILEEHHAERMFGVGEFHKLLRWLEAIPQSIVHTSPYLLAIKGLVLLSISRFDDAEQCAQYIQTIKQQVTVSKHQAAVFILQGVVAKFQTKYIQAQKYLHGALELLAVTPSVFEMIAQIYLADLIWLTQQNEMAIDAWYKAYRLGCQYQNDLVIGATSYDLATLLLTYGRRTEAWELCQTICQQLTGRHGEYLPLAGIPLTSLALLAYEANELDLADRFLQQAIPLCRQVGYGFFVVMGMYKQAQIAYTRGDWQKGDTVLVEAQEAAARFGNRDVTKMICLLRATRDLQKGDLVAVGQWVQQEGFRHLSLSNSSLNIMYWFVYVRYLLALGEIKEARDCLNTLDQSHLSNGQTRYLIVTRMLQAAVAKAAGNIEQALDAVAEAVSLAAPEKYIRPILDNGSTIYPLLSHPQIEAIEPAFVAELLAQQPRLLSPNEKSSAQLPAAPKLILSLFGEFSLVLAGQKKNDFYSNRVRALCAYLALHHDRPQRRDYLASLLWTNSSERKARNNLRNTLSKLKQILNTDSYVLLEITTKTVQLNLQHEHHQVDTICFNQLLQAIQSHHHTSLSRCHSCLRQFRQAVELYQGDFLTDIDLSDNPIFNEWQAQECEKQHRQILFVLDALNENALQEKDWIQVQRYAEQQLALEPWHEKAYWYLVQALAQSGERLAALKQYEQYCTILEESMSIEPSAQMRQLAYSIGYTNKL